MKNTMEGKCSVCGSENIDYGDSNLEDGSLGYDIFCNDCKASGVEWYTLKYDITIMKG